LVAPAVIKFAMQASERQHIEAEDWENIIVVDTQEVTAKDFGLNASGLMMLIEQGIVGAAKFLEEKEGIAPEEMALPDPMEMLDFVLSEGATPVIPAA
jgi:hypothetical protein